VSAAGLLLRAPRAPGEPAGRCLRAGWRVVTFLAIVLVLGLCARLVLVSVLHMKPPTGLTPSALIIGEPLQFALIDIAALVPAPQRKPGQGRGCPGREPATESAAHVAR
jgi:hypothetical protein